MIDVVFEVEYDEVPSPRKAEREREQIHKRVREASSQGLEAALDMLRLEGVSEQAINVLSTAMRMECMLRLVDLDLEEVAYRYIQSEGQTASIREAVALTLMPELEGMPSWPT